MVLVLLCVDGIDPDIVQEFGWGNLFKFNYSLKIPRECYLKTPDVGLTPYTLRVWPTIFSGQIIDYDLIKRTGIRKLFHALLVKIGITWKGKAKYGLGPSNLELETIFDEYQSFTWNLPTMNPEWLINFPDLETYVKFSKRELGMWLRMTLGALYFDIPIQAYYLRYVDCIGHHHPDELRKAYNTIFLHASDLKKKADVILLSDHGCNDGIHTELAYLGSDYPFNAEWVHEIRADFKRIFDKIIERK